MLKLYLNIPFSEKEIAKSLGAKWDSVRKSWYYHGEAENYINFAKWIFNYEEKEGTLIICDYFYILESYQTCWKCKEKTIVVGLGLEKFIELYYLYEEPINYEVELHGFKNEREVRVTWNDNEKDIPKSILEYLKNNYNVKTDISKIIGVTFANHCQRCNALQENYYLFGYPGSPFFPVGNQYEIIDSLQNINLKKIMLDENLKFNCTLSCGSNDGMFLDYCDIKTIKF